MFAGETFFKTFGNGYNYASLLVSRNEYDEIFMIQLVLQIYIQFFVGKQYNLVDIAKNSPFGMAVEPIHMILTMNII